jgi:hypothetical protein
LDFGYFIIASSYPYLSNYLTPALTPVTLIMFIPFLSHFRTRESQAWRVDTHPNDDALAPRSGDSGLYLVFVNDSTLTHPLERRKGGGGGGRGKGSSSVFSILLLVITAHPPSRM